MSLTAAAYEAFFVKQLIGLFVLLEAQRSGSRQVQQRAAKQSHSVDRRSYQHATDTTGYKDEATSHCHRVGLAKTCQLGDSRNFRVSTAAIGLSGNVDAASSGPNLTGNAPGCSPISEEGPTNSSSDQRKLSAAKARFPVRRCPDHMSKGSWSVRRRPCRPQRPSIGKTNEEFPSKPLLCHFRPVLK